MDQSTRRRFLQSTSATAAAAAFGLPLQQVRGQQKPRPDGGVDVLYPRDRIPLSFIIDDSTCLVNMGHFCTPQFQACYPDRKQYQKDWKRWPREIPDAFVREFGDWCAEHGVKGKYSIVPNPACVGWLDRELPGWSRRELQQSLRLVRESLSRDWDIHPEMITHTRVIDLKSGRPIDEISPATMENSYPREKKSVDELAAYLAYALKILRNCDLPCEGVTTPGGFGNLVKPELSLAVQEAVRDVCQARIPHYFKYVHSGTESTEPKIEHLSGQGTDDLRLTVNIPAGTGDWFGGWQGDAVPEPERYCNQDATAGRMVDLIRRGEPALMLCHWPGMYSNGSKSGFHAFQQVVTALDRKFRDQTVWMKLSAIARYWAARELTEFKMAERSVVMDAPFSTPEFTMKVAVRPGADPHVIAGGRSSMLKKVRGRTQLAAGTWVADGETAIVCFDLPQGNTLLHFP